MAVENKSLHLGHVGLLSRGILARAGAMECLSWSELKWRRDLGKLVAGRFYRVTDYRCTTVAEDTRSAGVDFDIILLAVSADALSEEGMAAGREGKDYSDTRLAGDDFAAWRVWYCVDNDTDRFAWADAENGRGVIYRMIDDRRNEAPYDFKNIEFRRYKVVADGDFFKGTSADGGYFGIKGFAGTGLKFSTGGESAWFTTFDGGYTHDISTDNMIEVFMSSGKQTLNNIVFLGSNMGCRVGRNCRDCSFGNYLNNLIIGAENWRNIITGDMYPGVDGNVIGTYCHENTVIGYYFRTNVIGDRFHKNKIGSYFQNNSVDSSFYGNEVSMYCSSNVFGKTFQDNVIGTSFYSNIIGNDVAECDFGDKFSENRIGSGCVAISAGAECSRNDIETGVSWIQIHDKCERNRIGNDCTYVELGDGCTYNEIGIGCDSIVLKGDSQLNVVGGGCGDIFIDGNKNKIGSGCTTVYLEKGCMANSIGSYCESVSMYESKCNVVGELSRQIYLGGLAMGCEIGAACDTIWFGENNRDSVRYVYVSVAAGVQGLYLKRESGVSDTLYVTYVTVHKRVTGDVVIEKNHLEAGCEIDVKNDADGRVQIWRGDVRVS